MDFALDDVRARIRAAFQSGISRLPRRIGKLRLPRGAWVFPVALILGIWANHGSREEGRLAWLRANPPAIETWRTVLARRGFGAIEDSGWREKAFAEMPDVGRTRDSILISEDHTTVALRTEGDWLYFGLLREGKGGQTVKRALWEPLGLGWEAVARFDGLALPEFRKVAEKAKGSAEWTDPRSLHY